MELNAISGCISYLHLIKFMATHYVRMQYRFCTTETDKIKINQTKNSTKISNFRFWQRCRKFVNAVHSRFVLENILTKKNQVHEFNEYIWAIWALLQFSVCLLRIISDWLLSTHRTACNTSLNFTVQLKSQWPLNHHF